MMGEQKKPVGPDLANDGIPAEDVGTEMPAAAQVDGKAVIVIRTDDGVRVVGGRCTHYGAPLEDGFCEGGKLHCPWHHAVFDLATGAAIGAPALNPVPVYRVSERDGRIYATGPVDTSTIEQSPPTNPASVVIVGSGAAGAAAAETLRGLGYTNRIALIGEEPPIDRPNLSKDYLAGTAPEEWMPLRSAGFYNEQGIELITGQRVTRIDRNSMTVHLEDGSRHDYGALLLAPGAEPRALGIPGADQAHVHYLRTLEESRSIISALEHTSSAVVIGAGFIGLEVAASLRQRDIPVTVIAPESIPLATLLGEELGGFVRDLHQDHGVVFHLGRTVTEIQPDQVSLDDGTLVAADMVVIGVGVKPRTELAEQAGLAVDEGIVVDDRLRTSDPDIWAAGDVARYPIDEAETVRVEHWVLAQRQGQTAAHNMLGHDIVFNDPPFFWSQHYDVPINVTGHSQDWDEAIVRGDPYQHDVLVAYRRNGKIRSVASIYRDLDSLRAEQALAIDDQGALDDLLAAPD
jgi:NADPH-dependent 2,4-dienoyl-CoA reductase/sulfur reductase-like enzyme/nitrite reductase/ring-hydroxylating ferredoxin subunit